MNCNQRRQDLKKFLEGSFSGDEARRFRSHLQSCDDCASALAPPDRIEVITAFAEEIEPSVDLPERFSARLAAHRRAREVSVPGHYAGAGGWNRILEWTRPRRLSMLGSLAALAFLAVYLGVRPQEPAPLPPPISNDMAIAENLGLLRDMKVIESLDFLEDFDAIQELSGINHPPTSVQ